MYDALVKQSLQLGISTKLKSPKTINCQEFNPQAMLEIKALFQNFNQ